MAEAKLWYYVAASGEEKLAKTAGLPLEPYVDREQVTTSGTANSSGASPSGTHIARIEVAVATRYRVNPPGETGDADTNDPPLLAGQGGLNMNWVHCPPGSTISLIEA